MHKCDNLGVMTGGNRIVAFDTGSLEADPDEFLLTEALDAPETEDLAPTPSDWDAEEPASAEPGWLQGMAAPIIAGLAIVVWSVLFVLAKLPAMGAAPGLDQWLGWVAAWSGPVLLICVIWLLAMRTSRREAARFGTAARLLGEESARLETRLSTVNGELSMAREFIAAQTRDLDALGRVAVERLSQNAEQLQALIIANSGQIESIESVSTAALSNMEKLRGQLPVIANSARDVTNNIANAGRTAHAQLQEMITGFKRLNEFGQASERQADILREAIQKVLVELQSEVDQIAALVSRRFDGVVEHGARFRGELQQYETETFAGLQAQSEALAAAIASAHGGLQQSEEQAVALLRQRVDALTAESAALAQRIASEEDAAAAALGRRLALLDEELASRGARQEEHLQAIDAHSDALREQVKALEAQLAEIAAHAGDAETRLSGGIEQLTGRILEGRSALAGADAEITHLTDSSVRLLELIQAGSQHSREHIPAAMAQAEGSLRGVEGRVDAMRERVREVAALGERIERLLDGSRQGIETSAASLEDMHARIERKAADHAALLGELHQSIDAMQEKSDGLTVRLQDDLKAAIDNTVLDHSETIAAPIERASRRAADLARETTIQLRDQLTRVDDLAGNLERRVARAREQAEEQVENDFVRRVALITESLNSNAIDIARALDTEVSDTAWAAYLKGDRGVFTRRAVNLIEAGEARAILQVYENDRGFHDQVSRYIHDFESMLRQVLSTRDGNALGVTLLSSDMGKLYVVLAQAIERLRR